LVYTAVKWAHKRYRARWTWFHCNLNTVFKHHCHWLLYAVIYLLSSSVCLSYPSSWSWFHFRSLFCSLLWSICWLLLWLTLMTSYTHYLLYPDNVIYVSLHTANVIFWFGFCGPCGTLQVFLLQLLLLVSSSPLLWITLACATNMGSIIIISMTYFYYNRPIVVSVWWYCCQHTVQIYVCFIVVCLQVLYKCCCCWHFYFLVLLRQMVRVHSRMSSQNMPNMLHVIYNRLH